MLVLRHLNTPQYYHLLLHYQVMTDKNVNQCNVCSDNFGGLYDRF